MLELTREIAGEIIIVRMHEAPHIDELVALLMFEEHGTTEALDYACHVIDDNSVLSLGCEGSRLDEHQESLYPQRQDCCATLVAKLLGLMEDPVWEPLLTFVYLTDTGKRLNGKKGLGRHVYDIGNLFKTHWRYSQATMAMTEQVKVGVVEQCLAVLKRTIWDQSYFVRAVAEIQERGVVEDVTNGPRVVLIESDNHQANAAARKHFKADVVVLRQPIQQTHIFASQNRKKRPRHLAAGFDRLAAALSRAELALQGNDPRIVPDSVTREGRLPDKCWYYHRPHALHNGTESYPTEYPPSQLTNDEIMDIIRETLRDTRYA
ncbi:MAG: hypothetical protein WD972_03525 [Candidatus Andersenbacteria bacterium]